MSLWNPTNRRLVALLSHSALAFMGAPLGAYAATSTVGASGQVGLTSYTTLPFVSSVWQLSWGAGAGFDPAQWFWQSGSHFTDPGTMAAARQAAAGWDAQGIAPELQNQRWVDTYETSQPAALFPGEPSFIAADRATGWTSGPEYLAWVAWITARPNLLSVANDGGSVPAYFRPWGGSWGHVSPLMPLAPTDCPPGMATCTFGDWVAWRWGQTTALSGAYAVGMSDFTAGSPGPTTQEGFNPELIASFEKRSGVNVPSGSTSTEANWIVSNTINAWNDSVATGYGKFFEAVATRVGASTGHPPLVIDQCSLWPSLLRFYGIDQRLFKQLISPNNFMCAWDDESMQWGRGGQDPAFGVGGYAMGAAREPDIRNGAILEANDSQYWSAISYFNPGMSSADQQEKGLKLLKRAWLEGAWAHVADRSGNVRRALAFVSRDYWDAGTIDPTLQRLISWIVPARPFGYAVYYSTTAERAVEQEFATGDFWDNSYSNPAELFALKNSGVPVDYFVSDAAPIASIPATARPAGWILLDHPELLTTTEMQQLKAIAPVFTSAAQAQQYGGAPLTYSSGLTGFGFRDQYGQLIITVTNPTATAINGTVAIQGIMNVPHVAHELFSGSSVQIPANGTKMTVPVSVGRWDTLVYAFSVSS